MSEEQINIAIAEACGREVGPMEALSDCCNDLNAMHEAVKSLSDKFKSEYHNTLQRIVGIANANNLSEPIYATEATARQRAEAFFADDWEMEGGREMNEQPTPETDAAIIDELDVEFVSTCLGRWKGDTKMELLAANFARKLERERDEARQAWRDMQSSFERSRDEVEKLIRERDEAREQLAFERERGLMLRGPFVLSDLIAVCPSSHAELQNGVVTETAK